MVHDPLRHKETVRIIQVASQNFADLEAEDQLIAHGYWEAIYVLGFQAYEARQRDPGLAEGVNQILVQLCKMRGAAQSWERGGSAHLHPEYRRYLDSLDSDPLPALDGARVPKEGVL